ncbi:hypothetical protein CDD83_10179 [Cordyceps sp. RAO-2017]|nr:hypothetical protein CDD83_10179 [Cordyceps sp. RAO-2017]
MSSQHEASAPTTHPSEMAHDYTVLLGVESAAILVAAVCVALRFYQQKRNWGAICRDDWACLGAMILCLGLLPTAVVSATAGHGGYHTSTYTRDELSVFWKAIFATELLYSASVSMSKLSALFFYRRIFSVASANRLFVRIMYGVVAAFWLSSTVGVIFSVTPVQALWEPWLPHTGISSRHFYVATGLINASLDLAILAFPQTRVWNIQTSRRNRVLLSLVFLMGGFVCVTSVMRLIYMATYDEADLTRDLGNTFLWTVLEPTMSIICCCLPILYKLFKGQDSKDSSSGRGTSQGRIVARTDSSGKRSQSSSSHWVPTPPMGPAGPQDDAWINSLDPVHIHREFTMAEKR